MDTDELKQELAKHRGQRGHRYPARVREAVVALSHENKSRGTSLAQTAEDIGLSVQTICYWRAMARGGKRKLARVAIVDDAERTQPSGSLTVECGPVRVSGLGLAEVVELMRMLT